MSKTPIQQAMPVVNKLIARLKEHGWKINSIDDGGDEDIAPTNDADAKDAIFAVDECRVYFRQEGGKTSHYVYLINSNGDEVISDWGYSIGDADGFDKLMEKLTSEEEDS
jgi:hypothetical protein